tara:strand:- start:461 stop:1222 length:762 start_codon:yes stop_codon:yes gene_type:complete
MFVVVAIPARLESSRLPNKLLADINGQPMIKRVLIQCSKAKLINELILCTDSKSLAMKANEWGFNSIITKKNFNSGSARIASVINKLAQGNQLNQILVINVQGDQPFVDPKIIDQIVILAKKYESIPDVITPIYKIKNKDIHNPNLVKTLITNQKEILYFSRSALPYVRDKPKEDWNSYYQYWGHVGIYAYRGDILGKWDFFPESELERLEKLEQLKLIDAGIKFKALEVEGDFLSIDTQEQLEIARKISSDF